MWTVSDDTVLHVDADGRIIALAAGTAIVTVSCDGASAQCTVTVEDVSAGTTIRVEEQTSTEGAVTSEVTVTMSPMGV